MDNVELLSSISRSGIFRRGGSCFCFSIEQSPRERKGKKRVKERGHGSCTFTRRFPYKASRSRKKSKTSIPSIFLYVELNRSDVKLLLRFLFGSVGSVCSFIKQIPSIRLFKQLCVPFNRGHLFCRCTCSLIFTWKLTISMRKGTSGTIRGGVLIYACKVNRKR